MGLAKYICLKFLFCCNAAARANNVLPVPATPCSDTNLTSGFNSACKANACSEFLGVIQ
jgi:hypothetical protein